MLDQAFNDLMDLPERFLDKIDVEPSSGCWLWTGYKLVSGYGKVSFNGKAATAHKVIYELVVGPIPPRHDMHHICRRKSCVNPRHVEPLTRRAHFAKEDHSNKGIRERQKTHCPHGHEYTPENTYQHRGHRHCKKCGAAQQMAPRRKQQLREYYLRNKEAYAERSRQSYQLRKARVSQS